MIKLDENYSIVADSYSWCLQKTYLKLVKDKKTGKEKEKEVTEKWWFPKISNCLDSYINDSCKDCKSIDELKVKLIKINDIVERVKKIYVADGKLIQID